MEDLNLFLNTTRKKALEVMQKGLVSYCLATFENPWDVAEHLGDGYDLVAMQNGKVARIELKAVDLGQISGGSKSFTQSLTPNEVVHATHVVISVFEGSYLHGNFILTIRQLFEDHSQTEKFSGYGVFEDYRDACMRAVQSKSRNKKGSREETGRLNLDISCTIEKFKKGDWKLARHKDRWESLLL